jgi:hypothetical protein
VPSLHRGARSVPPGRGGAGGARLRAFAGSSRTSTRRVPSGSALSTSRTAAEARRPPSHERPARAPPRSTPRAAWERSRRAREASSSRVVTTTG